MRNLVLTNQENKIVAILTTNKAFLGVESKLKQAIKNDGDFETVEVVGEIKFNAKGDYYIIDTLSTFDDGEYNEVYYLTEATVY